MIVAVVFIVLALFALHIIASNMIGDLAKTKGLKWSSYIVLSFFLTPPIALLFLIVELLPKKPE